MGDVLPDYDVILWIWQSKFSEKLEQEIMTTAGIEPYEQAEMEGVLDLHWGFDNWDDAVRFAERLEKYKDNKNIIYLKASNLKDSSASIVYKENR